MIVDCHTHIWQSPEQLGQLDLGTSARMVRRRATRIAHGQVRVAHRCRRPTPTTTGQEGAT